MIKKLLSIALLVAIVANAALAQSLEFKGDTAYYDQKAICVVTTTGGTQKHFTIASLKGEDLIYANPAPTATPKLMVYDIMFVPTAESTTWRPEKGVTDLRAAFVKKLIIASTLNKNGLVTAGVNYFILNANESERMAAAAAARPKPIAKIKRNTEESIFVTKGQIRQDGKTIALYNDTEGVDKDSPSRAYRIGYPDGTIVAEVSIADVKSHKAVVYTPFDRRNHTIEVEGYNFAVWSVAKFLVENDYL